MEKIWGSISNFSRRLANGVARLTHWQFIFLCLLALIGAGVLEGIIGPHQKARAIPPLSATIERDSQKIDQKDAGATAPESKTSLDGTGVKDEAANEIRNKPEGNGSDGQPASANPKKKARSAKAPIGSVDAGGASREEMGRQYSRRLPVAQIVVLLIVIMLAVRVATRSRLRAEERCCTAEENAEMEALRRQVTEAQLQALQAQVEPHFLFNTLAAVEHLTATDPSRAAVMLRHLIAYLRGALPNMREHTTSLGREVDLCQNYLAIMQIRMEDRLQVSIDVPESLRGLSFPPMMLQSLVENAIKHGLEPKAEGGAIAISAYLQEDRLRVTVADTGLGIAANAPQGIGLTNIRDRLKRLYANTAALILAPNAPNGAHITIEIPYVPTPQSDTGR